MSRSAVPLQIDGHDPQPEVALLVEGARGLGLLAEGAVPVVVEVVVTGARQASRAAEDGSAEVGAGAACAAFGEPVGTHVEVRRHVQIQEAVAVEVAECGEELHPGARMPAWSVTSVNVRAVVVVRTSGPRFVR